MADAYGSWAGSLGKWRCHIHYGIESETETSAVVYCQTRFNTNAWGFDVSGTDKATVNGKTASQSTVTHYSANGQTVDKTMITKRVTIKKTGSSQKISVSGSIQITGGYQNGTSSASGTVTVSARTYHAHGKPTIKASKTTANYGESVTISWAKSSTQGNANFDRFELWQGNTKLYSGSAISKSVKPSDVTGANGGTATYTVKEIHEWYGSYPSTQSSVSITVRSGVVSAYDSTGKKHTGLVTAYDPSGKSHYVLITAYDTNGFPHSVV